MLISCNSDVTGKRDFQKLKNDKSGYFAPCDDNHLYAVSFENHSIKKDTINFELLYLHQFNLFSQLIDIDYRKDEMLPKDELETIANIGEEMRPVEKIRQDLKYARVNYRYEDE